MMQTDVKAAHITEEGTLVSGPTRLKGLIICPAIATPVMVIFRDGGPTGPIMLEIDTVTSADPQTYTFDIPGEGIKFSKSIYLSLTDAITGVTIFHG